MCVVCSDIMCTMLYSSSVLGLLHNGRLMAMLINIAYLLYTCRSKCSILPLVAKRSWLNVCLATLI